MSDDPAFAPETTPPMLLVELAEGGALDAEARAALASGRIAAVIDPHDRWATPGVARLATSVEPRASYDGALLDRPRDLTRARAEWPRDAILGAAIGVDRHAAMVAGEAGADYLLCGSREPAAPEQATLDFLAWWRDLCTLPIAAAAAGPEAARSLVEAGADFALVRWRGADLAREVLAAIDRA